MDRARPNTGEVWVPWPVVRIDGERVRACWSTWWYVLLAGQYRVEVVSPVAASLRVEITTGVTDARIYEAVLLSEPARPAEHSAAGQDVGGGPGRWEGTHTGTARLDTAANMAALEASTLRSLRSTLGG